jgi:hypothetical protein
MQQYKVMARNLRTGQRIFQQQLDFQPLTDLDQAWLLAQALAESQQHRTRDQWAAEVEPYPVKT